jgi:hypothetical protein
MNTALKPAPISYTVNGLPMPSNVSFTVKDGKVVGMSFSPATKDGDIVVTPFKGESK